MLGVLTRSRLCVCVGGENSFKLSCGSGAPGFSRRKCKVRSEQRERFYHPPSPGATDSPLPSTQRAPGRTLALALPAGLRLSLTCAALSFAAQVRGVHKRRRETLSWETGRALGSHQGPETRTAGRERVRPWPPCWTWDERGRENSGVISRGYPPPVSPLHPFIISVLFHSNIPFIIKI